MEGGVYLVYESPGYWWVAWLNRDSPAPDQVALPMAQVRCLLAVSCGENR
jgi:hypothetical protein